MLYIILELIKPEPSIATMFASPSDDRSSISLAFPRIYNSVEECQTDINTLQSSVDDDARKLIEKTKTYPTLYKLPEDLEDTAVLTVRNFFVVPIESFLKVSNSPISQL